MEDTRPIRQALDTSAFDELAAERLGLNTTDLRCLDAVIGEPGITPSRLAELTGFTSGAITGVVDRLERSGYVRRRPDPRDRRSIAIEPVRERVGDVSDVLAPLTTAIDGVLGSTTQAERDVLARLLGETRRAIEVETDRLRAAVRGGFVDDRYAAPLGDLSRAELRFQSGAPRFSLNIAPLGPRAAGRLIAEPSASRLAFAGAAPAGELVSARFDGPRPTIATSGGRVRVQYQRRASSVLTTRTATIALGATLPWTIELKGGITDLTGSLAAVILERLEIAGGANHIDLELPRPSGTATVRISGVVSQARFRRPAGVPVAVRLAGGISRFRVDGGRGDQISGQRRYVGPGFDETPDRYDIEILGGAADVRID